MPLLEIDSMGGRFTWKGPTSQGYDQLFEKLDRALCNMNWRLLFNEASARTLTRAFFDHHPWLLISGASTLRWDRPFRFEATWLTHAKFKDFLSSRWHDFVPTNKSLKELNPCL